MSLRILILDEDPGMRELYRDIFAQTDYSIDLVENRMQAIRFVRDSSRNYDIMITDCGVGSHERRLDAIIQIQELDDKVVFFAISDNSRFRRQISLYESTFYVSDKPFSSRELLDQIEEIEDIFIK
jgi:DNA-binding NtrC family response regulator